MLSSDDGSGPTEASSSLPVYLKWLASTCGFILLKVCHGSLFNPISGLSFSDRSQTLQNHTSLFPDFLTALWPVSSQSDEAESVDGASREAVASWQCWVDSIGTEHLLQFACLSV